MWLCDWENSMLARPAGRFGLITEVEEVKHKDDKPWPWGHGFTPSWEAKKKDTKQAAGKAVGANATGKDAKPLLPPPPEPSRPGTSSGSKKPPPPPPPNKR